MEGECEGNSEYGGDLRRLYTGETMVMHSIYEWNEMTRDIRNTAVDKNKCTRVQVYIFIL